LNCTFFNQYDMSSSLTPLTHTVHWWLWSGGTPSGRFSGSIGRATLPKTGLAHKRSAQIAYSLPKLRFAKVLAGVFEKILTKRSVDRNSLLSKASHRPKSQPFGPVFLMNQDSKVVIFPTLTRLLPLAGGMPANWRWNALPALG
jgi:hypothetical protein